MRVSAGERGRKRKREREREKQNERTLLPKFLTCLQAPPAGQRYPAPCASSCAWWRWRGTAPRRRGRRSPGGGGGGALRRSRSRLLFFFFFERERRAWGRERSMRRLVHHIPPPLHFKDSPRVLTPKLTDRARQHNISQRTGGVAEGHRDRRRRETRKETIGVRAKRAPNADASQRAQETEQK